MQIYDVTDDRFRRYGRIIENVDFSEVVKNLQETTAIPEDVVYVASEPKLETAAAMEALSKISYGEMPIQIGYCNGHNTKLNAVEYHRSSEINVAATDCILILGQLADVEKDFTYDTAKMEAFKVPAGTAVEVFATSLHYAPCHVAETGFQVGIVLPKNTNEALEEAHTAGGEDALLTAKNKWLIGHAEGGLPEGSFIGLKGENLDILR